MAGENQTTETVFIDFQTDFASLQTAMDVLQATGQIDAKTAEAFKKTNAEIGKRAQAVNNASKATQQAAKKDMVSIEEVRVYVAKLVEELVAGMQEGVVDALKEAGFEFDEFGKVVKKGSKEVVDAANPLKKELREIRATMAQLKLEGKDNTVEFINMAKRAGELEDAIGDAAAASRRFASDTANLDGLIDIATGVAGGFSIAQGSLAIFGVEGEALQETLLKVNSAMAILQGLQAIQNVLQKESAASTLLLNIQQKVANANLILENALLSQSIVVRTGAAIAQKALNAAMAANPIGILVVAIAGLITVLATYGRSAALARQQTSSLNSALSAGAEAFEARQEFIRQSGEQTIKTLENEGAVSSQIVKQEIQNQETLAQARRERLFELQRLQEQTTDADLEQRIKLQAAISKLLDEELSDRLEANNLNRKLDVETRKEQLQGVADNLEARLALARKNSAQELSLAKQLARASAEVDLNEAGQDAEKQKLIRANLLKEIRQLDLQYAQVRQQDRIAALEGQLAREQRASQAINERIGKDEIVLQQRLIQEKANLELMQEGITAGQRLQIIQQSLTAQAALWRNFNQTVTRETFEDLISRNTTDLQQLNITNAERLRLTEENIIAQAEIEITAAQGLSDKIKEITAKRDADLKAARRADIEAQLQYELEFAEARNGVLRRANEHIVANERSTLRQRIVAINQLAAIDIAVVNKKQDALDEQLSKGLISQKDYNLQYEKLADEEAAIAERTAQAKIDAEKRASDQRIAIAISVAQQVLDIVQQAGDQELEHQKQLIAQQRQQVDDLLETGAITEKEAERRQKKLDLEERRLKRQQAQREKDFATFRAILAIPQAYLQGLAQGGPILAAIYAGLAAAQAIVIASKKPPVFAVGKKHLYEGVAEIGHGTGELWETETGIRYVNKPTTVWVGKHDKVYSPTETLRMLNKPGLHVAKYDSGVSNSYNNNFSIDYQRLGKEVGKNIPQTGFNFDADGFTYYVAGQYSFDKYLGKRRSY